MNISQATNTQIEKKDFRRQGESPASKKKEQNWLKMQKKGGKASRKLPKSNKNVMKKKNRTNVQKNTKKMRKNVHDICFLLKPQNEFLGSSAEE